MVKQGNLAHLNVSFRADFLPIENCYESFGGKNGPD
jgi:hypothetical protein